MYLPMQFKEERIDVLHAAIRQARLGTLVTLGPEGLEASHVPMLVDPAPGPYGTLRGHIAKANGQWRAPSKETQALAMFLGPHAYVTPAWYATKKETGKVVPTWNYVAIHANGPVEFFDDPERLLAIVTGLTDTHEKPRAEPWAVTDAPADFLRAQLKGIVGFELPIARLEGKWKMSQNRTVQDRGGVIEGLAREGGPVEATVSGMVAATLRD
ncbi:MAG: FMN-binding negative transcriptional regulator [Alphaproteobacteria bacterium]|nr:FMN-binding negative transcriptional regulator [Alphaproteobacteria bacterium]